MRLYTILILTATLTSSCKNIEKMIDKGNYDEAISYAVDKLQGKKDKPTKYVKALEKAYERVNLQDQKSIDRLLASSTRNRYDRVYDLYITMDRRQNTVHRLVPLVSEDGYIAELQHVDYTPLISTAAQLAAEYHYTNAVQLLSFATKGDKLAAREAYTVLGNIERYDHNYKNTADLYQQAYNLGLDHIGVKVHINTGSPLQSAMIDILTTIDVSTLDNFWTKHHLNPQQNQMIDYIATLQIDQINPGFERESYNRYQETRDIEDGTVPVKDTNGNTVKDTSGNIIYTTNYKTVTAYVTEVLREKAADVVGRLVVYDTNTNSLINTVPIRVTHLFDDYAAHYTGDYEALTDQSKLRLKATCANFPTDYDMVLAMASNFKDTAYSLLQDLNVRR